MPAYVAFLRAINLGATRRFPKDAIVAAVEAAGFTGAETYIASGNVRFDSRMRSLPRIEAALEKAFLADRGFEVPTIVVGTAELREIVRDVDELWAEHGEPAAHAVTLFKVPPPRDAVERLAGRDLGGDRLVIRGRAAHTLLASNLQESPVLNSKDFAALGLGTARYARVIAEVTRRWATADGRR